MKKKFGILLVSCLLVLLLAGCDEVLSVVTPGEDGKKVVTNYISMFGDTVYDESVSLKSWRDIELFDSQEGVQMDNLLFKIENKKENVVVLGDKDAAIEISFFDGGYRYRFFTSLDSVNGMAD